MKEGFSDSQQLADLYRRYAPSLYRRACWLTGEPEESVDITQAAFLSFMQLRKPLRNEVSPYTLLYTITTHKAVDRLRRRSRWTGTLDLHGDEEGEDSPHEPHLAMVHEGELRRMEAAQDLALLTQEESPEVLTTVFLHFLEGHSATKVGQVLNMSRQKVKEVLDGFRTRARARRERLEARVSP
jgi:RNA polymerase sigma-70 factor (ECF subfamily)